MTTETVDSKTLTQMILYGAQHLANHAEKIDTLNVFPVPDGDTGTNMKLSMTSGANEVKKVTDQRVSNVAEALAKGLLMGARGNSGVILSQLFRGFSKAVENKETLTTKDMAKGFQNGVESAYNAVMKPVEGTILTVAKDASHAANRIAEDEMRADVFMEEMLHEAKDSLKRTPELLPVLKEVGVVDSGGQGLVTIYEGFLAALKGEELPEGEITVDDMEEMVNAEHHKIAQDVMNPSEIEFGYCTEFMVQLEGEKQNEGSFNEETFRQELSEQGDSLLVVANEDIVKVHVHTEHPGNVLTLGQQYGSLMNMDIENMRQQHTAIVGEKDEKKEKETYAIISVAMGSGIKSLFESLGAAHVMEGGQTMNPSAKDISDAIIQTNAENVLILPNNKNIVMTAEQAAELTETNAVVISTQTIPQGISAMLGFQPDATLKDNKEQMTDAKNEVKSGQVTYAIRDTQIDGMTIEKGHYMGMYDGTIQATNKDKYKTVTQLLEAMISTDDEILTVLYGENVSEKDADKLQKYLEKTYTDLEVEMHHGNQPIYSYILAVE